MMMMMWPLVTVKVIPIFEYKAQVYPALRLWSVVDDI